MSKIVKLEVSNVKRVKFCEVSLDGNLITVGGMNEQGKSSLMDSIRYIYGGKKAQPPKPLRQGEEQGWAKAWEDNGWTACRKFGKGAGLEIRNEKGVVQSAPQDICDAKCGAISFDPLEFARLGKTPAGRKRQGEILMDLKGLDFSDIEAKTAEITELRKDVGKEQKQLEGELAGIDLPQTQADEEMSVSGLSEELQRRQEVNRLNQEKRNELSDARDDYKNAEAEVKRLENELADAKSRMADAEKVGRELRVEVDELKDEDVDEIRQQLAKVDEINAAVRAKKRYAEVKQGITDKKKQYEAFTEQLDSLKQERLDRLESTPWPIAGLGLDENGMVTYKDLPFDEDQLSSKQIARVSAAIGFALAPEPEQLRCMLIKNASLFDKEALAELAEEAKRVGYQVLVEIVGDQGDIIVENGMIKSVKGKDGTTPAK